MKCIIELGTNSLKFLLYRESVGLDILIDETKITRLGEGYFSNNFIDDPAISRTVSEIKLSIKKAKKLGCTDISIYGTMILRQASNAQAVIDKIFRSTGIPVTILSGLEEARLSFLAATHTLNLPQEEILVIDSGGGSTEFILGKAGKIISSISINLGAVTLTDKYSLKNEVNYQQLLRCEAHVNRHIIPQVSEFSPKYIIGIGGTVTTISAILQQLAPYVREKVQGSRISLEEVLEMQTSLSLKNLEERKDIIGLSPKRADIILGGVIIVGCIMDIFELEEMTVCDQGLRYGIAFDKRQVTDKKGEENE